MSVTLQRFNISGLSTDLSEAIGVTIGIIAGAYLQLRVFANSTCMGPIVNLAIGLVLLLIFPNAGFINGIGVGLLGYGIYGLIKVASQGAIV